MRGGSSSEAVGDAHTGNNEGGSIERLAMWLCVEEMMAAMSGRARAGSRRVKITTITSSSATPAASAGMSRSLERNFCWEPVSANARMRRIVA